MNIAGKIFIGLLLFALIYGLFITGKRNGKKEPKVKNTVGPPAKGEDTEGPRIGKPRPGAN